MQGITTQRLKIAWMVAAVALVAAVAVAWVIDLRTDDSVYHIDVVDHGKVIRTFDIKDINVMPVRKVRMQGQMQEGPSLLELLDLAGVDDFNEVTVRGSGARDSGLIVLKRSQVDGDVLLDVASRGTAKICGTDISWKNRVRDVERIEVR